MIYLSINIEIVSDYLSRMTLENCRLKMTRFMKNYLSILEMKCARRNQVLHIINEGSQKAIMLPIKVQNPLQLLYELYHPIHREINILCEFYIVNVAHI